MKAKLLHLLKLIPVFFLSNGSAVLPDLEERAQDFVLETKRIEIPDYPEAFNPSIVRWEDSLLMSFRTYDPKTRSADTIGLVWLDDEFNLISSPYILNLHTCCPGVSKKQDPRLITIAGRLFVVYNNLLKVVIGREIRRMFIAEIHFDGENFYADNAVCICHFDGEREDKPEKNWVPFDYKGNLLLSYSILPHLVFHPIAGTESCKTVSLSKGAFKWDWGVMRGGTPALLDNGEYLSFFHSCKSMSSVHSEGKSIPHYFMGAYTFSSHPPFAITRISPRPIIGKHFYHGPAYQLWKPLRVIFPAGLLVDDKYIWVIYGRQDHECWVAKLDKRGLYKSLIPIKTAE